MHSIIINIHILANVLFALVAISLCFSSIKGYLRKSTYPKIQIRLEHTFIILLYFGLLLGSLLYFVFPAPENIGEISVAEMQKQHNSQFWSIEHFSVMFFALMIAQIGKIFTAKISSVRDKFKYAIFYYGISTLIIFASMSIYLYHKFQ